MADFNNNIPQPGDFISDSQGDLLTNNKALDEVYDRNHYAFSTLAGSTRGKHRFVELTNQPTLITIPPTPALANLTGTVYTKTTGAAGTSNLFYTNDDSGREYQLTNVVSNASAAVAFPLLATNTALASGFGGWTWLGQGLIIQYGSVTPPASLIITFPVAFTSAPFSIVVTYAGNSSTNRVYLDSAFVVTTTQFKVILENGSGSVSKFFWQAIGPYNG